MLEPVEARSESILQPGVQLLWASCSSRARGRSRSSSQMTCDSARLYSTFSSSRIFSVLGNQSKTAAAVRVLTADRARFRSFYSSTSANGTAAATTSTEHPGQNPAAASPNYHDLFKARVKKFYYRLVYEPRTWRFLRMLSFASLVFYVGVMPHVMKDLDALEEKKRLRLLTEEEETKLAEEKQRSIDFEKRLQKELEMTSGKLLEMAENASE